MMQEWLVLFFLVTGTFFMLTGSIGVVRMPDLYTRMHALSKCITLGLCGLLLAAVFYFVQWGVSVKVLLAIAFQFLTAPVSAHMIARAAYHHLKVPFWENTFAEEWKDAVDRWTV